MVLPGGAWHDGHMGMATEGEKHDPWRNGGMTFDVACTLHLSLPSLGFLGCVSCYKIQVKVGGYPPFSSVITTQEHGAPSSDGHDPVYCSLLRIPTIIWIVNRANEQEQRVEGSAPRGGVPRGAAPPLEKKHTILLEYSDRRETHPPKTKKRKKKKKSSSHGVVIQDTYQA